MHILIDSEWSKMYDFVRKNLYSLVSITYFYVSELSVSLKNLSSCGQGFDPPAPTPLTDISATFVTPLSVSLFLL